MLKIKDNIDLKELEKYGFKPKYDEDTGLVKEYYINCVERIGHDTFKTKISFSPQFERFYFWKKRVIAWELNDIDWIREGVPDVLYDLIQAGLVEKVEG